MDFLRRLAPLRDTDATRAVAVLPSRFSSATALHGASAPASSTGPFDEGAFVRRREAAAAQRSSMAAVAPRQVGGEPPRDLSLQAHVVPLHAAYAQPSAQWRPPAEAPTIAGAIAAARAPGDHRFTPPLQASLADPQPAALPAAPAGHHPAAVPPAQARIGAPLSQAVVAQRALASGGDSPVVHVTIGRIDVVAGTPPPAPAARRGPKAPRPAAVSLADYLRAGSRR